MKRIVVIGNGKMAIDCLRIMKETPGIEISLVITEPKANFSGDSLATRCNGEGIACLETARVNCGDVIEKLSEINPDLIFNINSYKIIKQKLLSIPKEGVINFHNGPLPKYGGVNVCSWAIINGEKEHGVTWHFVDEGIDTGDIIAQRFFKIAPDETAVKLIMKCIYEGIALFKEIFPQLIEGSIKGHKQDISRATYFSLKDIPNDGFIDYRWPYHKLDSFIRGLSFHPMTNNFVYPKSICKSREFYIQKISRVEARPSIQGCGKVIDIGQDQINVQITDSIIGIRDVLDEGKNNIKIKDFIESYGIKVGECFESR